ncbi:MAG TPA: Calx-beta domain-containing protein [Acidobacteriota bacterium]|nr:Calx-beta domain-containing protein [Acidobacteriota bacterium]
MKRFSLCILFVCLTLNAVAASQLWIEDQKQLLVSTVDGRSINLTLAEQPLASRISTDGFFTYAIRSNGAILDIYENSSRTLKTSIQIGGRIKQIETDNGANLYLLDEASKSIRIFDTLTLAEKSRIQLPETPSSFAYNSANNEFYVGFVNASFSAIQNGKVRGTVSDLYRVPVAIHVSNKWRRILVRSESFVAVFQTDDLAFKKFLPFEGRPGRIELDSQQDFAVIQYIDRAKIEKFSLNTLRSEDEFYPRRKTFRGNAIDPATFHLNQDSLEFYDATSGTFFKFEEATDAVMATTPTDLPPGVTASNNVDINQSDGGPQFGPSIQVDSTNNMVFSWTTDPNQNGQEDIKGREFNANGNPRGAEFRFNDTTVNPQNTSMVAVRNNGDFMGVWTEESERDGQGWGVFGRRFAVGANPQDNNDRIIPDNPIGKQVYPVIAFGGGNYIVAWAGPTDGDGRGVWFRRFDAATGNALDSNDRAVNTSTAGEPWALDIAANPNGEFVIVWRDDSQNMDRIRARAYNANGTAKTNSDFRVGPFNTGAQRNFSPNVGIADNGSFVVVWLEAGAGGIVGERFNANSQSQGKFIATSERTRELQDNPSVDSAPNGSFVVGWKDSGYPTFEAIGRYFNSNGNAQGNDFRIPKTAPVNDDFSPSVAMTYQNNFVVAWYGRGRSPNIMARMFTVGGGGGNPSLSINDVSMTEGNSGTKQFVFTVSLSSTTNSQVTVNYATANGSATTGNNDYEQASGTLTIPANAASRTISVTVNGDTTNEGNENFTVNLSNATNATIADGQGVGTIQEDDGGGGATYSDNFNDGVLPNWDFSSPSSWSEPNGFLRANPTGNGKITGLATPVFAGCATCTVAAGMRSSASSNGIVTLIAWHENNQNKVELQMKEGKEKWTLKQKRNGNTVAKKSVSQTIDPSTTYEVEIQFDGTKFHLIIDGTEVFTMNAAGAPNGTVGFAAKRATGSFDHISATP